MKKILFAAFAAAVALTSCGNRETPAAESVAAETQTVAGGDLAYVQVEAVLAQSDLYLSEGKALQEKT